MTLAVRPGTPADGARCAEIYRPFVIETAISFEEEAPDAQEMAARIADQGASHAWLVAERDGRLAGYAHAGPHHSRSSYRTSVNAGIYVDPACARCGVGQALYAELLRRLKDQGRHAVFAGITLPNPASIAFHEAFGFRQAGLYREVGWKLGEWRDVGWWQLLL